MWPTSLTELRTKHDDLAIYMFMCMILKMSVLIFKANTIAAIIVVVDLHDMHLFIRHHATCAVSTIVNEAA